MKKEVFLERLEALLQDIPEDGTVHIDDTMCTGCGLCATLCKLDAIELVKAGER